MHGTLNSAVETGNMANDDDRAWYVLRIGGNRERTVKEFFSPTDQEVEQASAISKQLAAHLIARRFKVYVPMERKIIRKGAHRKKTVIERPLFIGYAFIRLDWELDELRLKHIRKAPGVIGFVKLGEDYAIISDKDMAIIGDEESKARDIKRRGGPWYIGEKRRITDGPFQGFPATVFQLADNERIKALVDIFGRKTPVWFEEDQLEKI